MSLLSADRIREAIGGAACSNLDLLEVFAEIGSTNSYLLDQPCPGIGNYRVALAEYQTAGIESPYLLAGFKIDRVQETVVGTHIQFPIGDGWRRSDS